MLIQAISIFPEMFAAIADYGVIARARKQGLWQFAAVNPRQFADGALGYIDDRPFGGGPGMIMQAPPLQKAIEYAQSKHNTQAKVIYMSPQGQPLTHQKAQSLAKLDGLIILCGRYEGVDDRLFSVIDAEEISIGDFVVSGGELPAMMLMDAVLRLVPGVLGDERSAVEDSFVDGLLDSPHYTKPVDFCGMVVPEVLRSGHHAQIAKWRKKQSLQRTLERRPDLLRQRVLNPQESCLLKEIEQERQDKSILE